MKKLITFLALGLLLIAIPLGSATLEGVTVIGGSVNISAPVHYWPLAGDLIDRTGTTTGSTTHAGTNRTYRNDSNEPIAIGANVPRFELVGGYRALLIEPARTNYFLNSTAPVTQTTESLGTGTYTAWIDGTGSATVAANTATITGGGAATDGSPLTFVVTGAGTVDVTIAGGPTRGQVEGGPVATSFIVTTGATATRATESGEPKFTLPTGLFDDKGTAIVWARFGYAASTGTGAGIVAVFNSAGSLIYNDLTGLIKSFDSTTGISKPLAWTANTWHKLIAKWGYLVGGVEKFRIGVDSGSGVSWGTETTFDGSYTLGANIRLGYNLFSRMHLRELYLFPDVLSDAKINDWGGTP